MLFKPAVCETHTHVRLGARHSGEPRLPGQHRRDVEVSDVHVPWRDKTPHRILSPKQLSAATTLLAESLWKLGLSVLAHLLLLGTGSSSTIFCPQDQEVFNQ